MKCTRIGAFRNVNEFEDRYAQPTDASVIASSNRYIDSNDAQKRLNIFSNVKAANVLPTTEVKQEELSEVSFLVVG